MPKEDLDPQLPQRMLKGLHARPPQRMPKDCLDPQPPQRMLKGIHAQPPQRMPNDDVAPQLPQRMLTGARFQQLLLSTFPSSYASWLASPQQSA